MKKRIITLTLSVLAIVMLVGVGFASWVISQSADSDATGNILVETVHDKRLQVGTSVSGSIQFGSPEGSSAAGKWLYEDATAGATVNENLSVTLTVNVQRPTAFTEAELAALSVTPSFGAKLLNGVAEEDYNTALFATDSIVETGARTLSGDKKTATVTFTVSLKWGSLFNEQNPYDFFNDAADAKDLLQDTAGDALAIVAQANTALGTTLTKDNTWADLALAALEKVLEYNNYKFVLTVSVA